MLKMNVEFLRIIIYFCYLFDNCWYVFFGQLLVFIDNCWYLLTTVQSYKITYNSVKFLKSQRLLLSDYKILRMDLLFVKID